MASRTYIAHVPSETNTAANIHTIYLYVQLHNFDETVSHLREGLCLKSIIIYVPVWKRNKSVPPYFLMWIMCQVPWQRGGLSQVVMVNPVLRIRRKPFPAFRKCCLTGTLILITNSKEKMYKWRATVYIDTVVNTSNTNMVALVYKVDTAIRDVHMHIITVVHAGINRHPHSIALWTCTYMN